MTLSEKKKKEQPEWVKIIRKYNFPDGRSWWQIANSVLPYLFLLILMYYSLSYSYWITLGLAFIAGGFAVRTFIIFHDCGHGSFFKSARLRKIVGIFTGLLLFTPYERWSYDHLLHHQTVGNLDKKGVGDVRTFTVEEYINFSKTQRFIYRLSRNPIVLFIIGPLLLFVVIFRIPFKYHPTKIKISNHLTTLALIAIILTASYFIGFKNYLLIQLPTLFFASFHGVWLFYIQHQYEDVSWARKEDWDFKTIALEGSSFLKLPKLLQWFSGNIGYHHIHHLSPSIPNYKLEQCYNENELFHVEKPLNFISALKCIRYRLWDEANNELIGYKELNERYGVRL